MSNNVKPPLYMVIDSDDTEYKYATLEDANEAFDLLLEVHTDQTAEAFARSESDDEEDFEISPEPYVMKWNADVGEWEVLDW